MLNLLRSKKLNFAVTGLFLVAFLFADAKPAHATVINSSFELGAGTTANNWTAFTAGAAAASARRVNAAGVGGVGLPIATVGAFGMEMNAFGATTSGAFQNVLGVTEGDSVSLTVDARTPNLTNGAGDGFGRARIEFFNSLGAQISAFNSPNITFANTDGLGGFATFNVGASAPAGTSFARITLTTVLAPGNLGAGDLVFDNIRLALVKSNGAGVAQLFPISIGGFQNNIEAWPGKLITVNFGVQNTTAAAIPAVELNLTVPSGLALVRNSLLVDNNIAIPEQQNINNTISFRGAFAPGEQRVVTAQILVTSGVTIGEVYDLVVSARNPLSGLAISGVTRIPVRIIPDTLFDAGTLLGKVFNDKNENGMQDVGEDGIPNVRLATEDGLVIYTDKHGKYSIPGLTPNRHLIKIDGNSLPKGTKFITEETFLFKTTPGMLSKVSFAVKLPPGQVPDQYKEDLDVYVSQYFDQIEPTLTVSVQPSDLELGQGVLLQNPVFHFDTNYGEFISDWRVEVYNEFGEAIWTGYGEGFPPSEVPWSGIGDNEQILAPGDYAFRLIVSDTNNHEDWTALSPFRVVDKLKGKGQRFDQPFSNVGFLNIQEDGKQSIPLDKYGAPVQVRGQIGDERELMINDRKVNANADGSFKEIVYLPYGKSNVQVASTNVEGGTVHYSKDLEVKDRYFFMVGIAEGELGYQQIDGSAETLGEADEFQDSFYQDGRVAFYLKGKIKGRVMITAHMDSQDSEPDENLSRLFTNLDPDSYYPVYGDNSVIDYSAQDSQERFYLLIEADRSYLKYGSFKTEFNDTELVQYNRTLSGAKVHFETLTTTKYGDPKAGFVLMNAISRQASDHNEFVGTGGSVYYLRHRQVIEGSEKLKIQVRDKVQNITISEDELVEGEDYEIDYQSGRILLNSPLTSVTFSNSIISNQILNGNRLFLIADYEYETLSIFDFSSRGIRGWGHVSDNLKIGGTWVRQTAQSTADDYIVRGLDATLRIGENTKITAEIAESNNFEGGAGVSFDGGLSFTDTQTGTFRTRSEAYSVKGQTRIGKRTEVSGYIQKLTPGYAVDNLNSQQGTRKYGINVRYRITDHLHGQFKHEKLEVLAPRTSNFQQVIFDPERRSTTSLQLKYARGAWEAIAEYRKQDIDVEHVLRPIEDILDNERFENAIALKVGYQALDWLKPYVRGQIALGGEDANSQVGFGAEVKLPDNKTIAYIEETFGNIGDSTLIGVEREIDDKTRVHTNFSVVEKHGVGKSFLTNMGSSHILDDRSRIYNERRYANNTFTGLNQQDVLGYDINIAKRWNLAASYERSVIDELSVPDKRNAVSVTIAYNDNKRLKTATKTELVKQLGVQDRTQMTLQHNTEFKINQDLTFKARLNTSRTRNKTIQQTEANFTEFNTGIAYRPIKFDRLNFLARYTYLTDNNPDITFQAGVPFTQTSHTIGIEGAYDMNRYFQLVQKFALRNAKFSLNSGQDSAVDSVLWASRINFHVTRKWDIAAEYRVNFQENAADDQKTGFLFEVDRKLYDYVRLGVGYDFTNFNEGINPDSGYEFHGFFVRLTGEF